MKLLLDHLHRGGAYAHWWHDIGKESAWFSTAKRTHPPLKWKGNIYFSVHPCTQIPDGDKRHVRSRIALIAAVNCFFGEFDAKDFGSKEGIAAHLAALPLRPSVIIDSGGGYHAYWLLADPVMIDDANRNHIKALQYAWVDLVGSDQAAKDLARVLRPVGTINRKEKYAPDFPTVSFVQCDLDRSYALEDFERLTEQVRQEKPKHSNGVYKPLPSGDGSPYGLRALNEECNKVAAAANGTRNDLLNKAAFSLATLAAGGEVNESYARAELLSAALAAGLAEGEAERTIESGFDAGLKKPRNAPERPEYKETPSAPSPTSPPVAPQDVIQAIRVIADKEQIITTLAYNIGDMERSKHGLVLQALHDVGFTKTDAKEFVKACIADAKARRKAERRAIQSAERHSNAIQTNDRQLSDVVSDAIDALQRANGDDPTLFVRGGMLQRIVADENGQKVIQEVTPGAMLNLLADAAAWENVTVNEEGRESIKAVYPPHDVITAVMGRGEWPLPGLTGIAYAPVFSKAGELHSEPGYSDKTRLHYTGGVVLGDIEPCRLQWAKSLILQDLLTDFPFRDDASVAHAVSYLITPFVRDMIDGPVPPHLVDAPSKGTGKSLLVNCCAIPFLGSDVPTMTAPAEEAEMRKKITTTLMRGTTHTVIDNVNHTLDSAELAVAWTGNVWVDRVLGGNKEVNLPLRTIWAVTANNIKMSDELTRRCVLIRLDANDETPWKRQGFKHAMPRWAKDNRDELVTAVLVMVGSWISAGCPLYTERVKGSYEAWSQVVGGILANAGIRGFLANEDELYQAAASQEDLMRDFVKAWLEKQQQREAEDMDKALSSFELFKLASVSDNNADNELGDWQNLLGDVLGSGNALSRSTRLGILLTSNKDKVFCGHKIVYDRKVRSMKFWRLDPLMSREEKLLQELQV